MGHKPIKEIAPVFLLVLIFANPTVGGEIYHWVDEDGVVHFSEWAPNPGVQEVATLTVPDTNPPGYDPNQDQSSIQKQAARTNDRWSELQARRDERKKRRIEEAERALRLASARNGPDNYPASSAWYGPLYLSSREFHHKSLFRNHHHNALDRVGLRGGRRPHSINSSAHRARILASYEAIRRPQSRHGIRNPGRSAPRQRPAFRDPH